METLRKNNLVVGMLCALCCEIIYGMSYIFTKQATKVASGFALLGWRFLIAFVIMTFLVLLGIVKSKFKRKESKADFYRSRIQPGNIFYRRNRRDKSYNGFGKRYPLGMYSHSFPGGIHRHSQRETRQMADCRNFYHSHGSDNYSDCSRGII